MVDQWPTLTNSNCFTIFFSNPCPHSRSLWYQTMSLAPQSCWGYPEVQLWYCVYSWNRDGKDPYLLDASSMILYSYVQFGQNLRIFHFQKISKIQKMREKIKSGLRKNQVWHVVSKLNLIVVVTPLNILGKQNLLNLGKNQYGQDAYCTEKIVVIISDRCRLWLSRVMRTASTVKPVIVIKFELWHFLLGDPPLFYKCFVPGPVKRLLKIRFGRKMADHII